MQFDSYWRYRGYRHLVFLPSICLPEACEEPIQQPFTVPIPQLPAERAPVQLHLRSSRLIRDYHESLCSACPVPSVLMPYWTPPEHSLNACFSLYFYSRHLTQLIWYCRQLQLEVFRMILDCTSASILPLSSRFINLTYLLTTPIVQILFAAKLAFIWKRHWRAWSNWKGT